MIRTDGVSAVLTCLCRADSGVIVSSSVSGGGAGGGADAYTRTQRAHSVQHQRETVETTVSLHQHSSLSFLPHAGFGGG